MKILIVDDTQVTRELIAELLLEETPDAVILEADDGATGLKAYKRHHPDLVITDNDMTIMHGVEMAEKIIEFDSDAKIMMISGSIDKSLKKIALSKGVIAFFRKPEQMAKMILRVVDEYNKFVEVQRINKKIDDCRM